MDWSELRILAFLVGVPLVCFLCAFAAMSGVAYFFRGFRVLHGDKW